MYAYAAYAYGSTPTVSANFSYTSVPGFHALEERAS